MITEAGGSAPTSFFLGGVVIRGALFSYAYNKNGQNLKILGPCLCQY